MPAPTASRSRADELTAVIGFTLPPSRMAEDESSYLTYQPGRSKPQEKIRVPITDLRAELDLDGTRGGASAKSASAQLEERGFAVMKHESKWYDQIPSAEGTKAYLDETADLLKEIVGCSRVIAWNSVCRKNSEDTTEKKVTKQQRPEEGFIPATRLQPIAGVAHIDQNAEWGFELCGKAAGKDASEFKRVAIINLWRPLHGECPVTNAPLAMLDYRTISPSDIGTHASQFGFGHDIHHSLSQSWSYIRHQMPDEIIWLKCYDSDQGKGRGGSGDGAQALYCGHAAVQVDDDADGIEPDLVRPRESIEVRLVALWE